MSSPLDSADAPRGKRFNTGALGSGLALLLLGLISLAEAYVLGSDPDANRLHQTLRPGLYVSLLGGVIVGSGLIHLWRNAGAVGAAATQHAEGEIAAKYGALPLVVSLVVYVLLIERLGYVPASIPFFFVILRLFGVKSWLASGALAVLLTGLFYVLFVHYLGVILPRGILEGIIP